MPRLTNMYYAQYESNTESEPGYDSDNPDAFKSLMESPSQAEFRKYLEQRRSEELLHESWKLKLREKLDLAENIKEQCGMAVDLKDDRVCYVYKPAIESTIVGIKFKITFEYIKLLRKWYLSLGHSRLPDVINIQNKFKDGIYDPIKPKVLAFIQKVKNKFDIYVQRLVNIYKVIDTIKETYKYMEFEVNPSLTDIKAVLKDEEWPKSIKKISRQDCIAVKLSLDANLEVSDVEYEYVYSEQTSTLKHYKMCIKQLEKKLQIFFDYPLIEAFITFMKED
ncbi:uncharacterized protein LOC114871738 [Osmia bicornis bicornis]|uniref:uncharacterized protein LOC114871738 n=1 Tax=Osmia bicornis bicornis TaxID=1437191 RepID=UPI001EAF15B6|nr:uncharacterized protein LOC114871738 [Osmia bicornis bicornis]